MAVFSLTQGDAINRLNEGFGFRASGHLQEAMFARRLQEAQRDLEKGKTLPRFLLLENQSLFLAAGTHNITYPGGFIRDDDDNRIHYTPIDSNVPYYLTPMRYNDAVRVMSARQRPDEPQLETIAPQVYTFRNFDIDFITTADVDYNLTWNYYAQAAILNGNGDTNLWLQYAPEWLIGEAGERIARSLRDQDALAEFQEMKTKARAAIFGDMIADEDMMGPLQMGRWL